MTAGGLATATGTVRDAPLATYRLRDRFAAVFQVERLGHGSSAGTARVVGAVVAEGQGALWLLTGSTQPY